eukprot:8661467-Alexandrium_andersonii.AAC.1
MTFSTLATRAECDRPEVARRARAGPKESCRKVTLLQGFSRRRPGQPEESLCAIRSTRECAC